MNDAAAKTGKRHQQWQVIVLTIVIIVLPTSPRTMRLAMNGINAIENEKNTGCKRQKYHFARTDENCSKLRWRRAQRLCSKDSPPT